VEGAKTNPKDNGKNKAIMSGRSPFPPNKKSLLDPNKFKFPNDPPSHFPILRPYNVVEYLEKFPTHMTLLDDFITPSQFRNVSHVLQAPLTLGIIYIEILFPKRPPLNQRRHTMSSIYTREFPIFMC